MHDTLLMHRNDQAGAELGPEADDLDAARNAWAAVVGRLDGSHAGLDALPVDPAVRAYLLDRRPPAGRSPTSPSAIS